MSAAEKLCSAWVRCGVLHREWLLTSLHSGLFGIFFSMVKREEGEGEGEGKERKEYIPIVAHSRRLELLFLINSFIYLLCQSEICTSERRRKENAQICKPPTAIYTAHHI
jgi:hypothetical protein